MLLYFLIGFLCLILSSLSQEINQNGTVVDDDSFYPNASPTLETFDWQLVKEISPNYKNILISPISLKLVLALLYEGSGGDTEREFQNVLQFDKQENVRQQYNKILTSLQASERKEYILNIGTRIFLDNQKQPQRKFSSIAYDSYQTEIEPTNFDNSVNASVSINSWIQKLTNGRVSQIVKPDDLTRSIMIITNAIYFKGTWRHQFPKNQTQIGKFYVKPKETINVPFMSTIEDFYIKENTDLDATFLRLPYKGGRYSLWIILPNSKGGLPGLIKKINTMHILDTIYSVYKRTVQVNIPKFKFSFQENYVEILKKFGLKQMFQNTASFPGIVRGNSNVLRLLQVSDIIQKTGIELDEEGSVVYAATAVNIGNKFGEPQFIFNATHPFMFFLYEETASTILFIGKVENPLETENRFSQEANKISSEGTS